MAELTLYRKLYDFALWCLNKTDGFPRSKRLSCGLRLENLLLDALSLVNSFCYRPARSREVERLSLLWDETKLLIRLCYDLKLVSKDSFAYAAERATEIGELLGGLRKRVVTTAQDGKRETRASRRLLGLRR